LTASCDLAQALGAKFQCAKHKAPAHIICLDTNCFEHIAFTLCKSCYQDHPKNHPILPTSQVFSRELLEDIQKYLILEKAKQDEYVQTKLDKLKELEVTIEKTILELNLILSKVKRTSKALILENENLNCLNLLKDTLDMMISKYCNSQMKIEDYVRTYIPLYNKFAAFQTSSVQEYQSNLDGVFETILNDSKRLQETNSQLSKKLMNLNGWKLNTKKSPVVIRNVNEIKQIHKIRTSHSAGIWKASIIDEGAKMATVSDDRSVRIWDIVKSKQLRQLSGHTRAVPEVLQLQNGKLASRTWNEIIIWSLFSGQPCTRIEKMNQDNYYCIFETPANILVAGGETRITFWKLDSQAEYAQMLKSIQQQSCYSIVLINNQGLACSSGSQICIYRDPLNDDTNKVELVGHSEGVRSLLYSSKGNLLISGARDHIIKIWSLDTFMNVIAFNGHTGPVRSLILTDCETMISSSDDGKVKFWNLGQAECVKTIVAHENYKLGKMELENSVLVTCGDDRCVKFWLLTN